MNTGTDWMIEDIKEVITVEPHVSAFTPDAIEQLQKEVDESEQKSHA